MNGPVDLSRLAPGFGSPDLDSQTVFRACLDAMSSPGRVMLLDGALLEAPPGGVCPAAASVLLALLDQDTTLWLGDSMRTGDIGAYLRFHTGCAIATSAGAADFVLCAAQDAGDLSCFRQGTDAFPDRSATIVMQCERLSNDRGWRLTGPGIREHAMLHAGGVAPDFPQQWAHNRKRFPCGVDLFLASGLSMAALPRTTRLEP